MFHLHKKAQDLPHRIRRSIILYTAIGFLLTGTAIALVCLYPMYRQLRQFADKELEQQVQNHALTIQQYLSRLADTTLQITSRTQIRQKLIAFNQDKISSEELVEFSRPKLIDALKLAVDSVGMIRLDSRGVERIKIGEAPSWDQTGITIEQLKGPLLIGPIVTMSGRRLLVAAPILDRNGQRVGADLVSFSFAGIFKILAQINTTVPVSQVQLAVRLDKNLYFLESKASINSFRRLISPDTSLAQAMNDLLTKQNGKISSLSVESQDNGHEVVALVRIEGVNWIISVRMSQSELYAIPNRMIGFLIPLIGLLMLLGALGSILMLNPLTGKVILQAEEYEQEIQNQTKTLKKLELANTQIDNILRSVPSGLLVCDSDQKIILANQAAATLFGFDVRQVTNCRLTDLVKTGLLPKAMRALVHPDNSQAREVEILVGGEGLQQKIVRAESSAIQSRTVLDSGTIIILHDITKDRELDRMKSEFISTAAHELRTPLTVLIGYAEMLADPALSANFSESQKKSFLKEISEKGLSLSTMIDDLLDISRIESGQPLPLHLENSDLLSIISKVTQQISLGQQHHRFVVKLLAPPKGCSFQIDPDRIRQVMENLLGNAVKYSPAGSKIKVTGKCLGKAYQVTVADEGIGINESDLPKVFDKFFRADSSNTAIGGLGLGLSVVQKILQGHGGEIYLESSLGEGTRAIFTIPICYEKIS